MDVQSIEMDTLKTPADTTRTSFSVKNSNLRKTSGELLRTSGPLIKTNSDPHLSQLETDIKELREQLLQLTEKINKSSLELKKDTITESDETLKEEAEKVIECFKKLSVSKGMVEEVTEKTGNGVLGAEKGSCSVFIITALDIACYVVSIMAFIAEAVSESKDSSTGATSPPEQGHSTNPWLIVKYTFGAVALLLTGITGMLAWWYKKNKNRFKKLNGFDHSEVHQLCKILPFVESIKVAAEKKDEESIKKCLQEYYKVDVNMRIQLLPTLEKFIVTAIDLFPAEHSTRKLLEQIDKLARQKIVEVRKLTVPMPDPLKRPKPKVAVSPILEEEIADSGSSKVELIKPKESADLERKTKARKLTKSPRRKGLSWSNDYQNVHPPKGGNISFENASPQDNESLEEDLHIPNEDIHESMSLCFEQLQKELGLQEPITAINLGKNVIYNPKNIVITAQDIEKNFVDTKTGWPNNGGDVYIEIEKN